MSTLLDRKTALEMARNKSWGHDFDVDGYCACGAVEDPHIPKPWCPVKIANALLEGWAQALEWAISQEEFQIGALSAGRSGVVLVSELRKASEAARRELK